MRTRLPTPNDEWNSRFSTGPTVVHVAGDGVRLLHLAEDLRLADDQRVEARGDAEQMPRGVEVRHVVDVRRDLAVIDAVELADEAHQVGPRRRHVVARDVELGAVARREHHRLARRSALGQRAQRAVDAARLKVDALAQLDRRGAVTDSDEEEML